MKVRGDAASAVLDHSSGTPGEQEFQEADITRLAYNHSQRIELKREAMTVWTEAVFAAVEAEWAKHQPKRSHFRPAPPPKKPEAADATSRKSKLVFSAAHPWYLTMERERDLVRKSLPPLSFLRRVEDVDV